MKTYPHLLLADTVVPKLPEPGLFKNVTNPIENKFSVFLRNIFPEKCFQHRKVILNQTSYFPDISYIDESLNIFIDIEIDEPYSRSMDPTHFIENGEDLDTFRNIQFLINGWHIIRFSEKQIINDPKTCLLILNFFINQIITRGSLDLPSEYHNFIQKCWTREDSLFQMKYFVRDYYNYEVAIIEQDQPSYVFEYSNREHFSKDIISKYIKDFKAPNDIILMPYFISELYSNNLIKEKLIFLNCISYHGWIKNMKIASQDFKYTVSDTKNENQLSSIILKKKQNHRIVISGIRTFVPLTKE